MIKMHCDRCDKSEGVKWTRGKDTGEPIIPGTWGEVTAPEGPTSQAKYVLCEDCLTDLHIWVKGETDEEWTEKLLDENIHTTAQRTGLGAATD